MRATYRVGNRVDCMKSHNNGFQLAQITFHES